MGRVEYRGESITNISNYRKRVAVISQDDVFVPVLTVRETLRFYGRLRLRDSEQVEQRVQALLKDVRLEDVADTTVCV